MNLDRLLRVREQILGEPARFSMDDFVWGRYDERNEFCGTVLCIGARAAIDAGFVSLRTSPRPGLPLTFYDVTADGAPHGSFMLPLATAALDLSEREARRLFHLESWPANFWGAFLRAKSPEVRASIAGRRIDHFIVTEGRE